ncbi:single-stranded DNA-binding protein [Micromonospora sp. NPDC050417]|uniref:single-stranded DNA-binding protein n=1 Tax=Micromonospora sp. NPDC050417 TaxID=3364280 RepID=UPI0037A1F7E9
MFDTYVTIVGNVLTAPEWRRTTQSGTLVANFKVASTSRRLDRESGRWIDGNSLRVRVNCWRKLAEGVSSSVMTGDPVIVVGRMYTRDWVDDAGNHRTMYEMEAVAVGHDLSRGRGQFARNRPTMTTSSVEDGEAEHRVQGEPTEPVSDELVPARLDGPDGEEESRTFLTLRDELPELPPHDLTDLGQHEVPPDELAGGNPPVDVPVDRILSGGPEDDEFDGGDPATGADGPQVGGRARRGRARVPVPA